MGEYLAVYDESIGDSVTGMQIGYIEPANEDVTDQAKRMGLPTDFFTVEAQKSVHEVTANLYTELEKIVLLRAQQDGYALGTTEAGDTPVTYPITDVHTGDESIDQLLERLPQAGPLLESEVMSAETAISLPRVMTTKIFPTSKQALSQ